MEKLPISMKTKAMITKKEDLENRLFEIENAIKTFSKKQVFLLNLMNNNVFNKLFMNKL